MKVERLHNKLSCIPITNFNFQLMATLVSAIPLPTSHFPMLFLSKFMILYHFIHKYFNMYLKDEDSFKKQAQ